MTFCGHKFTWEAYKLFKNAFATYLPFSFAILNATAVSSYELIFKCEQMVCMLSASNCKLIISIHILLFTHNLKGGILNTLHDSKRTLSPYNAILDN